MHTVKRNCNQFKFITWFCLIFLKRMEKGVELDEDDGQMQNLRKMVSAQNRKKKKSGGFQSMGNNS